MKLKLGTKIAAGFVIILILMAALAVQSYLLLDKSIFDSLDVKERVTRMELDYQISDAFKGASRDLRGYLLYGDSEFANEYQENIKKTEDLLAQRLENCSPEAKPKVENVIREVSTFNDYTENKVLPLVAAGKLQEANVEATNIAAAADNAAQIVDELITENNTKSVAVIADLQKAAASGRTTITTISLIAILVGIIVTIVIIRMITKPILATVREADRIAQGDLTGEELAVNTRDEVARLAAAFNNMRTNLRNVVAEVTRTSGQVSESSSQLASQAQQTAAGANETSSTMTEIAATVEQITDNIQQVSTAADDVSRQAMESSKGVDSVVGQMANIETSSRSVGGVINNLHQTTGQISQIVDLITHIADQTNLLALNAAIEAARAGEQGRGFAVVAEEVRKLAEQSANAAKEIYQLINSVQKESEKAVEVMTAGAEEVTAGSKIINDVGNNIKGITSAIEQLTRQVQEVAASAEEISAGVQNIAGTTEEQTAAMEEVSAASEELTALAQQLDQLATRFKM